MSSFQSSPIEFINVLVHFLDHESELVVLFNGKVRVELDRVFIRVRFILNQSENLFIFISYEKNLLLTVILLLESFKMNAHYILVFYVSKQMLYVLTYNALNDVL